MAENNGTWCLPLKGKCSSQLLCIKNVDRKRKKRPEVFYFKFGSMLEVLGSYFVKQRENDMDVIFSSNREWTPFCYDASFLYILTIGTLVLLHADIRRNKILQVSFFSFHYFNSHKTVNKILFCHILRFLHTGTLCCDDSIAEATGF